jgi:hypothetical protein
MLALTRAMQAEVLTAVQEGDPSLVGLLCRELAKAAQLMLTKVEGMVSVAADTRTISSANSFARSASQAHNASLLVLLVQFKEALLKLPAQVAAAAVDAAPALVGGAAGSSSGFRTEALDRGLLVLQAALQGCCDSIEQLAQRQILDPVVALLSSYVTSIAVTLHKEGALTQPGAAPSPAVAAGAPSTPAPTAGNLGGYTGRAPPTAATPQDASAQDCSSAVQLLLRNLPPLLRSHLLSLPKCEATALASEEIFVRSSRC